jgi:hypothetical protein
MYLFEFQLCTNVLPKFRIFKFLKRDCGTIPVAEITSGNILHLSIQKLIPISFEKLFCPISSHFSTVAMKIVYVNQ